VATICEHHLSNIGFNKQVKHEYRERAWTSWRRAFTQDVMVGMHFPVLWTSRNANNVGHTPNPLMEVRGGVPGSRLWVKRDYTVCLVAITRVASASPPDVCINICGASAFFQCCCIVSEECREWTFHLPRTYTCRSVEMIVMHLLVNYVTVEDHTIA